MLNNDKSAHKSFKTKKQGPISRTLYRMIMKVSTIDNLQ